MTDLQVVAEPAEPKYPAGLHIRLRYDADSCHAAVYEGEDYVMSTGYSWIKSHESWAACRETALNDAREKVALIQKYGRPPANEVVEL